MKTHSLIKISLAVATMAAIQVGAAQGPQPSICTRSCWGARAPKCSISQMASLNRAIVHHTAGATDFNTTGLEDSKAKVRGVQNIHMDSNGWCDIGYHFLVDKYGHIFEGRSGSMSSLPGGAHDGHNVNSFGFTLLGYFHSPHNQSPPAAMRSGLYDVIAWRMPSAWSPYGSGTYNGNTVGFLDGHRKVKATACPGDIVYNNYVTTNFSGGEARNELNARKNGGTQNPPYYFDSNLQGWQPGNGSSALAWQGGSWPGVAYGDQIGNDCFWLSPVCNFTGGVDSSINVRVYPQSGTTANHDMKMYWITAADPGWSESKSTPTINYTRQNGWISLNLSFVNAAWTGHNIKQLRLDFDSVNSSTRWIVNHVYSQQTPRHWFSSNTEGWTVGNGLGTLGYSNSGWPGII
ncbi:MAG: N-acetylmuramoyl-L-alanine amidase, partial [Limisphaerales bacterium]